MTTRSSHWEVTFEVGAPHRVRRVVATQRLSVLGVRLLAAPLAPEQATLAQHLIHRTRCGKVDVRVSALHQHQEFPRAPTRMFLSKRDERMNNVLGIRM